MATNLLESYKGRLSLAEKYYAQQNAGKKLSNQKKMVTAMCINNVANYINEAFANSVGTQRADLGKFKSFCLDVTTLTMPNLIVNDLFMVAPMASFSGFVTYMEYALGTEKGGAGGVAENDPFGNAMSVYGGDEWNANNIVNSPFVGLGQMSDARMAYTGAKVVENVTAGTFEPAWTPVVPGTVEFKADESSEDWAELTADSEGKFTISAAGKVRYVYDNQYIPAKKLPTLVGRMKGIALSARARRIAVYYSQLAAYQSKTDYGIDLEAQISQQAQAELQYEIDTEAVMLIKQAAEALSEDEFVTWTDGEVNTISVSQKAEGFLKAIEKAKMIIYKKTNKFLPNWMVVSPDVMPVLSFVKGFEPTSNLVANGPYLAGTVAGLKVFVSPALEGGLCLLGVLAADGKTATGVYAPYMPIVPTQLLGFADGTMSQGFSTLYDMKILNAALLTKIVVNEGDITEVVTIESSI